MQEPAGVAHKRPLRFVDTSGDTGLDQVLEVYEIVERLSGGGSGGVVLLAEHRKTREKVAIKEIPKTALNTDRKMEMARREMDIMMMVSEEAPASVPVVRLHAIVETSCFIHVVMEVAEGGELFDHIVKAGCYSETNARHVMRQLLEALRHLHGMGITHRDIKPENILCTDANGLDIKLADFGLSSLAEASSMMRSQCGTPIYMAPEMLQRRPYGAGVDVWSAGIVMYTVLSGTLPFYAENHGDFVDLLLSEAVSFPEDEWGGISREATDLISGMLAVDPKRRLSVEEVLAHPWMRAEA